MSEQNTKDQKKNPLTPLNWILGFEYIVAIIVLILGSLGYVLLK